ncbi:putative PurR-regulated permease PerM [Pararhizobium capsulatum DSM 1112]|uniref:PurR-regulated permease PerM n=1 Tax=Pararhizobium capsulatum DSM 1112 TaxID=1121113 RepID=A0ABU0BLX0_9HYPH|nr:AI-2E family transporter [Pararhizobium capsulatum]MDQ0319240.1 putative PurR-regulated permease PerM [Pararhizobium capsulatum DSM 1112]
MGALFSPERQFKTKRKYAEIESEVLSTDLPPVPPPKTGLDLVVAWSVVGTFIILASAVIYLMETILMPITLAIVVGMVLGLAADRLVKFGLPPALGGILLGLVFVVGLFFLINALIEPLSSLAGQAPGMIERAMERILPYFERFQWVRVALEGTDDKALADMAIQNAGSMLGMVASGLTPAFVQTMIFLAALGLFLLGRAQLRKTIILAFATRERRLAAIRIMNAIESSVGFYFSTASVIYMALGSITAFIAFVGGFTMAPLWGLFAFVSSFIPYLGVTAMTIALLCAGLMTHDALLLAMIPAAAFFLLHLVMENLVTPAILGHRLEINPFIIFIAIIFWTWMWGAVGAMLAMPLSLIAMTIFEEVRPHPPERQLPA